VTLVVRNLMLFYENTLAVNNISLTCGDGKIVGILGANAAGKSSLVHAISGIVLDMARKQAMRGGERITVHGDITFDREPMGNLSPSARARRGVILCPERRRIFTESSVMENLRIGSHLASRSQARRTLEFIFHIFPPLADRRLRRRPGGFLSGGEQQMLAIGRALMAQPKLLLLDEPLLGLSPLIQFNLVEAIQRIRQETEISVLIAEQYARPILPIIDHASIMENGSLVMQGTREQLMKDADVQSAYFGVQEIETDG
jgi:branched-chain amino acid transport system ATP-binding protein